MLVLAVTWIANEGHEQEMLVAFLGLANASRQEPGCRMYVVHEDRDDARRFFVYEQYDDEAALEAHKATPHFKDLARGVLPSIGTRTEAHLMNVVA